MASKTIHICDRCKKEFNYCGRTVKIKRLRKFALREILNGNPSGYDYSDNVIELCRECTCELRNFLLSKK